MQRALRLEQTSIRNRRRSRARLNHLLLGRVLLSLAAAGGLLLSGPATMACDYCDSVELDYDTCDGVSCDSMGGCNLGGGLGGGKIFRALDAVAGGVEKLMGFDKCGQGSCGCDSLGCDGGCDGGCNSYMAGEVMMPMTAGEMGTSMSAGPYVAPQPAPYYSAPRMPHPPIAPRMAAPRMAAPRAVAPSTQFRMSEPMIVAPHAAPRDTLMPPSEPMNLDSMELGLETEGRMAPRVAAPRTTTPRTTAPRTTAPRVVAPRAAAPPVTAPRATAPRVTRPRTTAPRDTTPVDRLPGVVPTPTPVPMPAAGSNIFETPSNAEPAVAPKKDGGSLFDTLDDPFGDDVRFSPRQPVQMRPTSYRKTQLSQPIRLHAPQASNRTSTRRQGQKAATQNRVAHGSRSVATRSVATNGRATTPLRTGSSFRTFNNSMASKRTTTRQASHHHQSTMNSGTTQRTPQLAPAPSPRRSATTHSPARTERNVGVQNVGVQNGGVQNGGVQVNRTHVHQAPAVQPRSGQTTGQRHSTAGYSGYGHTTNRR